MNERNNNFTYGGLAVLICVACFAISWKFFIPKYTENNNALAVAKEDVSAANEKLQSLDRAKSSINSLGDIVDKMFVAVPKDGDIPGLITELEAIASKNKTYIPSIQYQTGTSTTTGTTTNTTTTSGNTVAVSFGVNGSFSDLSAFVRSLESNIKFFNIKSLVISSGKDSAMSFSVQLETYKIGSSASTATPAATTTTAPTNIN